MWADGRTISEKLYAGMAALLVLTILEGAVAVWGSSRIRADAAAVSARSDQLQRAQTVHTALIKMESGVKTLLWAGLDNDRAAYDASRKAGLAEYERAIRQVDELTGMLTESRDRAVADALRQN